jgi:hypothetical protein
MMHAEEQVQQSFPVGKKLAGWNMLKFQILRFRSHHGRSTEQKIPFEAWYASFA